jgi:hypothetical protein
LQDWSAFLKARNCLNKMKLSCRSLSLVGFCWPFSPVADISGWYFGLFPKPGCHKRSLKIVLVWQPWQRSRWFCFVGSSERVEEDVVTETMELRYLVKRFHDQVWFSCVLPVTAPSRAVSAATRSATSWFLWAVVLCENDVEAERGKICGELLLVHRQFNQNRVKGHLRRCFRVQGTTGSIPWCLLWGRG